MGKTLWGCEWCSSHVGPYLLRCLLLVLLLNGCATVSFQPHVQLSSEETLEVFHSLRNRETNIHSAKGLFRASISGSGIPITHDFDGVVFYDRPDSIRMKGFTRVGGLVFDFVRNQEVYQLQVPGTGRSEAGRIDELGMAGDHGLLIRLSLRAMQAILGKVDHVNPDHVSLYEYESRLILVIPSSNQEDFGFNEDLTMRLWIDRGELDVIRVEYMTDNGESRDEGRMRRFS